MQSAHQTSKINYVMNAIYQDILAELAKSPRYVSELLCLLNLPQSTLSNRLRVLQQAGLIQHNHIHDGKHRGKNYLYSLVPDAIKAVVKEIRGAVDSVDRLISRRKSQRA